jgi:CRISPR-associated protein Cas2
MFDLPVDTSDARREYREFRKALIEEGFMMLQYSVYARYFKTEERSEIHRKRIKAIIPGDGQVRLMMLTDVQFGKMEVYFGKKHVQTEQPPEQLAFF